MLQWFINQLDNTYSKMLWLRLQWSNCGWICAEFFVFDFSKQQVTVFFFVTLMFLNAGFANSTMGNMRVLFVTNRFDPIKLRHKSSTHAWCKEGCSPNVRNGKHETWSYQSKWTLKRLLETNLQFVFVSMLLLGFLNMCKLFFDCTSFVVDSVSSWVKMFFFRQAIQPNEGSHTIHGTGIFPYFLP